MSETHDDEPAKIPLTHLLTFYQAARSLNFSRAALALGSDQPSVSRRVKELEQLTGQALFFRGSRGVRLTPAGERLLELSAQPIEAILRLPARFAEEMASAPQVEVSVIGGQQLLLSLLGPALLPFQDRNPGVRVAVVNALKPQVIDGVRSGRADVGLTSATQIPADLHYDEVVSDELVLLLPSNHRLAGADRPGLVDLANETILLPDVHSTTRQLIISAFRDVGVPLLAGMELQRWEVIREFVALGAGVAIAPSFVAGGHPGVVAATLDRGFPRRSYGVLTARTRHLVSPARELIAAIKAKRLR